MRNSYHASTSAQKRFQQTFRSASDHADLQHNLGPESLTSVPSQKCIVSQKAMPQLPWYVYPKHKP